MAYTIMLPESLLELQTEVRNHHKELFEQVKGMEYEEGLGAIAASVNVVLDDYYTPEDLEMIQRLLLVKLQAKRIIIIR